MKCASCAAENPAGARFCVQCGAEQAVPTPIAAVAAAVAGQRGRAAVPHAANAAQADPTHEHERAPRARASAMAATPMREAGGAADRRTGTAPTLAPAQPAYAHAPSRGRLAVFLIVLALAVGALGLGAWRMLAGDSQFDILAHDGSVMSSFPPEVTPSPRRPIGSSQPSAPPSSPMQPEAPSPTPAVTAAPEPAHEGEAKAGDATGAAGNAAPQPIEIRSLPAKPAPRPAHRRAAAEKAEPAAPSGAPAPAPPAQTRAPEVAAAATPATPVVDRWTRMSDELSRCTREDFIARVICDQRVRFRYCNGYWGKIPQCPGNPAPERGQ